MTVQKHKSLSLAAMILTCGLIASGCNESAKINTAKKVYTGKEVYTASKMDTTGKVDTPGKNNFSTTASSGIGSARGGALGGDGGLGGGLGGKPNFADAAKKLGVTEKALEQAIQDAGGSQADLAQVAKILNVSEVSLKEALLPRPTKVLKLKPKI
jgi:hypothetical protein